MNFLAHALLSPDDSEIMFGNVLGDFIKGRPDDSLSPAIWQGVQLHRSIDRYTDSHPVVRRSIHSLSPEYSHYARVILDVYHDHLLALHFESLSGGLTLQEFIGHLNQRFRAIRSRFPDPDGPHQLKWLVDYRSLRGVNASFHRLARRSRRGVDLSGVSKAFSGLRPMLEEDFLTFFPQIQAAVCV